MADKVVCLKLLSCNMASHTEGHSLMGPLLLLDLEKTRFCVGPPNRQQAVAQSQETFEQATVVLSPRLPFCLHLGPSRKSQVSHEGCLTFNNPKKSICVSV